MRLTLVKQGEFLGTKCDFYVDDDINIYMSRTQIGYALQYKQPQNAIVVIHKRHKERMDKYSVQVKGCQFDTPYFNKDKNADVYMYNERGVYEICRYSNQIIADEFNDWVYEIILSIKKNGYYITSGKDDKWLGVRSESKQVRKHETDQIKFFVEYARQQGSQSADRYYTIFTKLVNSKLMIGSGQRDDVSQETLFELKALETLVKMRVKTMMEKGVPYKEIYQDVKKMIESL